MNKKLRNDVILVATILITVFLAFTVFKLTSYKGKQVQVLVNGKVIKTYSLDKDLKKVIKTENGKNVLVIKNSTAYITEADCRDKICAEHRPISNSGQTIVCLPHKLVVTIK